MKRQIQDDPMYDEDIEEKIGIKFRIVEVGGWYKIQKERLLVWSDIILYFDGDYCFGTYWYNTKERAENDIKMWKEAKLCEYKGPKVIEEIDV